MTYSKVQFCTGSTPSFLENSIMTAASRETAQANAVHSRERLTHSAHNLVAKFCMCCRWEGCFVKEGIHTNTQIHLVTRKLAPKMLAVVAPATKPGPAKDARLQQKQHWRRKFRVASATLTRYRLVSFIHDFALRNDPALKSIFSDLRSGRTCAASQNLSDLTIGFCMLQTTTPPPQSA